MSKKIIFGFVILLVIVLFIKFVVFNKHNTIPPPPGPNPPGPNPPGPNPPGPNPPGPNPPGPNPPGPNPPPSEWNGYYEIIYPYDSVEMINISDEAPYLNLTPNFTTNYLILPDDIGSKIGKDNFPILKCSINNKYVSVIFEFDPVNFIDLSNFTIRYDDKFYVNMGDANLPKNTLIGSLFFDKQNNILSAVLQGKKDTGFFVVANVQKKKFYFDIPENSYKTNVVVNNWSYQPQKQPDILNYTILLPDPVALQIANPIIIVNVPQDGLNLQYGTDIWYKPFDSNVQYFLIQSKISNVKTLYLTTDNTYNNFISCIVADKIPYTPAYHMQSILSIKPGFSLFYHTENLFILGQMNWENAKDSSVQNIFFSTAALDPKFYPFTTTDDNYAYFKLYFI